MRFSTTVMRHVDALSGLIGVGCILFAAGSALASQNYCGMGHVNPGNQPPQNPLVCGTSNCPQQVEFCLGTQVNTGNVQALKSDGTNETVNVNYKYCACPSNTTEDTCCHAVLITSGGHNGEGGALGDCNVTGCPTSAGPCRVYKDTGGLYWPSCVVE